MGAPIEHGWAPLIERKERLQRVPARELPKEAAVWQVPSDGRCLSRLDSRPGLVFKWTARAAELLLVEWFLEVFVAAPAEVCQQGVSR